MIIPISWLNDYVDVPQDTDELMKRLTAIGHMQDGPAQKVTVPDGENSENNQRGSNTTTREVVVYDLEVRQNRSDCLSMMGIARETAAAFDLHVKWPTAYQQDLPDLQGDTKITIEDEQLCHRFQTLTFDQVELKPSPSWLTSKLVSYGIKPINIIVDITNYVMVELGQPLHAFDAQQVEKQHLVVRSAKQGEKLTVLGGKEISLTTDDLIIADEQKPLALAGVIGGESSGVNPETKTIIIEAANYNQASIRRSALRHLLRTEASSRLEKFLHPQITSLALKRVKQLVEDLTGAKLVGHADAYPQPREKVTIPLRMSQVSRLGGISILAEEAQSLLAREEIPATIENKDTLQVEVPYFRTDLEQEADLIEEVLRLYGYENIPSTPVLAAIPKDIQSPYYDLEEKLRDLFTALGYDEQITEPLTTEDHSSLPPIKLENSLTSEKSMLRTTLSHDLEQGVSQRQKYRHQQIKLFEIGRIYYQPANANKANQYQEDHLAAAIATGPQLSFSEFKGDLEAILARLGYSYQEDYVQIKAVNSTQPTFYGQINLEKLLALTKKEPAVLTSPPQLVLQDLSLQAPANLAVGKILTTIKETDQRVYQLELGEKPQALGEGKKSVFVKVSFHDPQQMLSTQDVEPIRQKILENLASLAVQNR